MTADSALPHLSAWCQRWRYRRHSWVPRRHGGFDASRYTAVEIGEADAREFVTTHHYAASWPAARLRFGLFDRHDGALSGVLVLGVPMHPAVLTRPFPELEPYTESLDLARLVLLDEVAANAESWFTTAAMRLAAERGVRGVVAFADPVPRVRHTATGPIIFSRGHTGTVYQACSAVYTGLATPRSLTMLPDATVLPARTASKLINGERGARGVVARLVALGATAPGPGSDPRQWLSAALRQIGATTVRHPGNHRYLMRLGGPAQRRRIRIALASTGYPKRNHTLGGVGDR